LDGISCYIDWEFVGIDNTFNEVKISGHEFFEFFVDQHTSNI